jgi:hypothetical protein
MVSIKQVHTDLLRGIEQGYFKKDLNVKAMSIMVSSNIPATFQLLREYANMTRAQAMDFIIDSFIGLVANEKGLAYYNELKEKI